MNSDAVHLDVNADRRVMDQRGEPNAGSCLGGERGVMNKSKLIKKRRNSDLVSQKLHQLLKSPPWRTSSFFSLLTSYPAAPPSECCCSTELRICSKMDLNLTESGVRR